jgi:hypothetical protein
MNELTYEDKECLRQLRRNGCAVTVFLPHEMGEADPEAIEERMCVAGWTEIKTNGNVGLTI